MNPLSALRLLASIFFVLLSSIEGNHEGYLGLDKPLAVLKETNIRVLDNEIIEVDGLQIIGIRYPERDQASIIRHLLIQSGLYDEGNPSILLYQAPTNIEEK